MSLDMLRSRGIVNNCVAKYVFLNSHADALFFPPKAGKLAIERGWAINIGKQQPIYPVAFFPKFYLFLL